MIIDSLIMLWSQTEDNADVYDDNEDINDVDDGDDDVDDEDGDDDDNGDADSMNCKSWSAETEMEIDGAMDLCTISLIWSISCCIFVIFKQKSTLRGIC